jgi:hypothetical protein
MSGLSVTPIPSRYLAWIWGGPDTPGRVCHVGPTVRIDVKTCSNPPVQRELTGPHSCHSAHCSRARLGYLSRTVSINPSLPHFLPLPSTDAAIATSSRPIPLRPRRSSVAMVHHRITYYKMLTLQSRAKIQAWHWLSSRSSKRWRRWSCMPFSSPSSPRRRRWRIATFSRRWN